MAERIFPIAETFHSIQGEGTFAGVPMFFIRMAGCNVGTYAPEARNPFQVLHPEYSTCTSFSGESFICDTNYKMTHKHSISSLIQLAYQEDVKHVSITGGEPFMHHDLPELVAALAPRFDVHIETSGTIPIPHNLTACFITCSPKQGFLPQNTTEIFQYKFLVRDPGDEEAVSNFLQDHKVSHGEPIWIMPIEEMGEVDGRTMNNSFAVQCVKRHPEWRLCLQVHKILGVR